MTCDHAISLLTGVVVLGPGAEPALQAHLGGCETCAALQAELLAIDHLTARLPLPEVPDALHQATLVTMDRQIRPRRRLRWVAGAGGLLAATALLALRGTVPAPDTSAMVERGTGERLPEVALKVAVEHQGQVERHAVGRHYSAGDTLYFRASVDLPAALTLVRVSASGARVVHRQAIAAGEADLALARGPMGWRLEVGEDDAVFALLATLQPLEDGGVEAALRPAYDLDAGQICAAAATLDARCSAVLVPATVSPEGAP